MREPDDARVVELAHAGIRLGQFLKVADVVESGAAAKELLAGGGVRVNGEVENRRGRHLVDGDLVAVAGELAVVRVRSVMGEADHADQSNVSDNPNTSSE